MALLTALRAKYPEMRDPTSGSLWRTYGIDWLTFCWGRDELPDYYRMTIFIDEEGYHWNFGSYINYTMSRDLPAGEEETEATVVADMKDWMWALGFEEPGAGDILLNHGKH